MPGQAMQTMSRACSSSVQVEASSGPPSTANGFDLGGPHRVGPGGHGIEHGARGLDELELDRAAVGLVVGLEDLGQALVGLADLVDRVVDAQGLADDP